MLVAIPAHDEAATVITIVESVRRMLPEADLLVVDDGSQDETHERLKAAGVRTARHSCNLGYGRSIQTALKYALSQEYDVLVTLDADGQHDPEVLPGLVEALARGSWDLVLGSRYVGSRSYGGAPLGRRIGMRVFSFLVALLCGRRVYDTTSGLRVMRRSVFVPLVLWHFVDFHAEAIAYLLRLGYRVGEHPVAMHERRHGRSMHSFESAFKYPAKTLLMLLVALVQAELTRRRSA